MALMYLFDRLGYSSDSMEILNRCRRFHCVHSLADILRADGKTIDPVVMSSQPGESTRLFSWEQPTQSDLRFWCTTIKSVVPRTIPALTTIGNYISTPRRPYKWLASQDKLQVYHLLPDNRFAIYQRDALQRTMRSGARYTKISTHHGYPTDAMFYASVDPNPSPNMINLHSTCDIHHTATNQSTFLSCLRSFSNQSLWDKLEIDGDGDWLITSILNGTLEIGMDGSYMKDLSKSACSGAFILHCTSTGQEIRGCFVDSSHRRLIITEANFWALSDHSCYCAQLFWPIHK
eukprot:scaffold11103_cov25-Cyclotella_meneghiniana.AAC.3